MRFSVKLIAALIATTSVPTLANEPASPVAATANIVAGAKVFDAAGDEVGTIDSVSNGVVVLDTGSHKASLEASSITTNAKGLLIGLTKVQLDTAIVEAAAKAAAALEAVMVVDAEVHSTDGVVVGKVKEVTAEAVVIDRPAGAVGLPKGNFMAGSSGLTINMTAAKLDELVAKAATAPAPAS